jgi:hypothetical protein
MKAAFVIMTILGCDDAGSQCRSLATVDRGWQTIAACDAASDSVLNNYRDADHPMVVAVCQTAETTALVDSEVELQETAEGRHRRLSDSAIALLKNAIPSGTSIRKTLELPRRIVTDTYSWVARKISD